MRVQCKNHAHSGLCKRFLHCAIEEKDKQDGYVILRQFLSVYGASIREKEHMSARGGLVDAFNAIKYLQKRLKQDLPREVIREHSTTVVANAMGRTEQLQKAEERASEEGWIDADDLEKELEVN